MKKRMPAIVYIVGFIVAWGFVLSGCSQNGSGQSPAAPAAQAAGNYAQMPECPTCSTTAMVNGELHQINLALSDQPMYPYNVWFYVELNEQRGRGKQPGEDQTAVNLNNVVFTFTGLPGEITTLFAALKTSPHLPLPVESSIPLSSCRNPGQNQDGSLRYCQFAVQNGAVAIPVANVDLTRFFGETHFSAWFQAVGGQNGNGPRCGGRLAVTGTLPNGQVVTLGKAVCFGANPAPLPVSAPIPFFDVVVTVSSGGGTSDIAEFYVQEPGAVKKGSMFDDGTKLDFQDKTTGHADSILVDQNWASGADPFHMFAPLGTVLNGEYQAVVTNNWADRLVPGNCPATDPLPVTLTVKTHTAQQSFTCNVTCDSGIAAAIAAAFPSGAIQTISCP